VSDDLVGRAKRGDRAALETLIERHMPAVFRLVALRLGPGHPAVEDVAQEALVGAATSVRRLRGDDETAFVSWLLTITRHKIADCLREQYSVRATSIEHAAEVGNGLDSPEDVVATRARNTELREALGRLTPEQEEVVILKFVLGYGNEDIAAITRRTVGAVKSMQHRALASLERQLSEEVEPLGAS